MLAAFLSSRVRSWVLFTLLLPVAGRALRFVGAKVGDRHERTGKALSKAGGLARRRARKQDDEDARPAA